MKKESLLKLKQVLKEERKRADGNYVAFTRIQQKYSELNFRLKQIRLDVRLTKQAFDRIVANLDN